MLHLRLCRCPFLGDPVTCLLGSTFFVSGPEFGCRGWVIPCIWATFCMKIYNIDILFTIIICDLAPQNGWKVATQWKANLEKVYIRSQILECPSIGEYWNISGVPVFPENVIFTFFRTYWCYSESYNTGMQKWSSIVQYSCTRIWDLKYTFSANSDVTLFLANLALKWYQTCHNYHFLRWK